MNRIMKLISPAVPTPPPEAYVPKRHRPPTPHDLAEHRPLTRFDDEHPHDLDDTPSANLPVLVARSPAGNAMRDVALAMRLLSYQEKTNMAKALRTSVSRINTWASLMLED